MKTSRTELTSREMDMCLLLFKGETYQAIADKVGVHVNTVRTRLNTPQAKERARQLREEKSEQQIPLHSPPVEVERKVISFTRDDAAAIYLEVCKNPSAKDSDKIRAADSLVALYRIIQQPATQQEGEPDVYKAAWMQ